MNVGAEENASGPRRHDEDPVGEEDRLVQVVRDEEHRLTPIFPQPKKLELQADFRLGIERAERLIHQHDLRVLREQRRELAALAHTAGKLARVVVLEAAKSHRLDQRADQLGVLSSLDLQRQCDVASHRLPRKQGVLLEHVADLLPATTLRRAQSNLTRLRGDDRRQDVQERALAAAARPDDRDELTVGDVERDILEHIDRVAAGTGEGHADVLDLELRARPRTSRAGFERERRLATKFVASLCR
jgi:hypothetical protein